MAGLWVTTFSGDPDVMSDRALPAKPPQERLKSGRALPAKPPQERREQQRKEEGGPTGVTAGRDAVETTEPRNRASARRKFVKAKFLPSPARDLLGGGMWCTDHTYGHRPV